jgi:RNA polymerase sigma-70 factor (ECF subfamily)
MSESGFASLLDRDLAAAIVGREPAALEEAYRRHAAPVLGIARRLVFEPTLAEEVLQEVFLRLWRQPERFDADRGSLRTYLLIEANARAIELIRSDSSRRDREDRHTRLASEADYDVEREVWDGVVAEHIHEALESLTDGERTAIELAYFAGYTYRQVAAVLDQPEGTVKSRIRTGLMRLRDRLLAVDLGDTA